MSVELAGKYGEGLRVNAIAPGFFIGEQNRALLLTPDGDLTARGEKIIEHTPMGRFGVPEDLDGVLLFLCSDLSKFVTGIVVHVDGGFAHYATLAGKQNVLPENIKLHSLRLQETETSFAEWYASDNE